MKSNICMFSVLILVILAWSVNGQFQAKNIYQPSYETLRELDQIEFVLKDFLNEHLFQDYVQNITATAPQLSQRCSEKMTYLVVNQTMLMAQLIDIAGKPGPGMLSGNTKWVGDYDTCIKLGDMSIAILYFTVHIVNPPILITWGFCLPEACSSKNDTTALLTALFSDKIVSKYLSYNSFYISQPPSVYTGEVLTVIILSIFAFLAFLSTMYVFMNRIVDHSNQFYRETYVSKLRQPKVPIYTNSVSDELSVDKSISNSDVTNHKMPYLNPELSKLLKSNESKSYKSSISPFLDQLAEPFSLYTNIETVFNTEQPPSAIKCLNGIRSISMFWVILGHGFLFSLSVVKNPLTLLGSVASRFSTQPIVNAYFAVDTFFVLSGFLVMYLSLRELSRTKTKLSSISWFLLKFYVHRILRITPTLFIFLIFFWKVAKYLGDGPFWDSMIGVTNQCDNTWWHVILYINNFFSINTDCISWTWYLADDMQFFIISPLFIFPAYFFPFPFPFLPIIFAIVISLIPTVSVIAVNDLHANFFFPYNHLTDGLFPSLANVTVNDLTSIYYTKPYTRISAYLVGLALGYLIYKISVWKTLTGNKRALNMRLTIVSLISWPICIACLFGLQYGLYSSYHGHVFSKFQNILYLGVCRVLWGVGLSLFIFICYAGYGGPINTFLSMDVWVPLSRLTFATYLVHPLILFMFYFTLRQTIYYSDITFAFLTVAFVVMSYGAGAVIAVFIEFPLANLENLLLKRKKKK